MALRRRPAGEASNHLELRWLMTVVMSVWEKAHVMRQVAIGKVSVSERLMTCREVQVTSKSGRSAVVRDEPGGCPFIGQVVSGMKAARARSAASARNLGRQVSTLSLLCRRWRHGGARGSAPGGGNREYRRVACWRTSGPAVEQRVRRAAPTTRQGLKPSTRSKRRNQRTTDKLASASRRPTPRSKDRHQNLHPSPEQDHFHAGYTDSPHRWVSEAVGGGV